jgi:NADH:ubiquinone oxidoreductase subunit 3 (subunit A)
MDLTGISIDLSDYIEIATFLVVALVTFCAMVRGFDLLGSKSTKKGYRYPIENGAQYLSKTRNYFCGHRH